MAGHDLPHVYTSWDLFGFGGRAEVRGHAVVFDDTGEIEYEATSRLAHLYILPGQRDDGSSGANIARFVLVDGGGHSMHESTHADRVARLIADFAKSLPTTS